FRSFFFSSRRRHTRFSRDWSSDVCSSDLAWRVFGLKVAETYASSALLPAAFTVPVIVALGLHRGAPLTFYPLALLALASLYALRSEERRVGKDCIPTGCPPPENRDQPQST